MLLKSTLNFALSVFQLIGYAVVTFSPPRVIVAVSFSVYSAPVNSSYAQNVLFVSVGAMNGTFVFTL